MSEEVVVLELGDVGVAGSSVFGGFCWFLEGTALEGVERHACSGS